MEALEKTTSKVNFCPLLLSGGSSMFSLSLLGLALKKALLQSESPMFSLSILGL